MQKVDGQRMQTTEEIVGVYESTIAEALSQYCIDHDLKDSDLYGIDQSRWNAVLLYIHKKVFKPLPDQKKRYNENSNIDYSNKELLNSICDIYIDLCYEYSKEISIMGFSKLTGIHKDTIYEWLYNGNSERGTSDLAKKLNAEREESLSNKLASGKGNPVGILGILNRHYGWNMGQPRGQDQRQKAPDLPGMEQKYLGEQRKEAQLPEFPQPDD